MSRAALALLLGLQFLAAPAAAGTLAVADGMRGAVFTITDDVGPCVGPAKLATWTSADGKVVVPGCYIVRGNHVLVSFFDGDRADLPFEVLRKPVRL